MPLLISCNMNALKCYGRRRVFLVSLSYMYFFLSMCTRSNGFKLAGNGIVLQKEIRKVKQIHEGAFRINQIGSRSARRLQLQCNSMPTDEKVQKYQNSRIQEMLQSTDINPVHVQQMFEPLQMTNRQYYHTPLKSFGCIFQLDCLVDLEVLYQLAWGLIAKEVGREPPSLSEARRAIGLNPTDAVRRILRWTMDYQKARQMGQLLNSALEQVMADYTPTLRPQSEGFLEKLRTEQVPTAVVAHIPAELGHKVMESCGIQNHVRCGVFQEDAYGLEVADAQGFLKAALKLKTTPKNIVVFDCRPEGLLSARDVEMKAVGVMGEYHGYELSVADLTVPNLDAVDPNFNLRRLFDNDPEPELETEVEVQRRYEVLTKTKTEELWMEPQTESDGARFKPGANRHNTYDWNGDDSDDGFYEYSDEPKDYDLLRDI